MGWSGDSLLISQIKQLVEWKKFYPSIIQPRTSKETFGLVMCMMAVFSVLFFVRLKPFLKHLIGDSGWMSSPYDRAILCDRRSGNPSNLETV